jgi:hypothetical protein
MGRGFPQVVEALSLILTMSAGISVTISAAPSRPNSSVSMSSSFVAARAVRSASHRHESVAATKSGSAS